MIHVHLERLPRYFFLLALCILCPLQWLSVGSNSWFRQPPKPVGDGPDYENIAFHLWQGSGFVIDSTAPAWRTPYENSSHDYAVHLASPPRTLPTTGRPPLFPMVVAAIYGLVGRNEWGFAAVRLFSASCLAVAGALAVRLTAELLVGSFVAFRSAKLAAQSVTFRSAKKTPPPETHPKPASDGAGEVSENEKRREAVFAERKATQGEEDAIFAERKATKKRKAREQRTATERRVMLATAGGAGATLLFVAVNRTLRDYATDFLTEPLAMLLMQSFVLLAIRVCTPTHEHTRAAAAGATSLSDTAWLAVKRLWGPSLLAGITWGALILTRSMFVVWLPMVWLLFVMAAPQSLTTRIKVATLIVVVAGLVCAPWWVRNCIVLQHWMPLGTQGPTTLLGGYSDEALHGNGDWQAAPELQLRRELSQRPEFQALENDSAREVWVAQAASDRVRGWFWSHLHDMPLLVARRMYVHWNPYSGASLLWKLPLIIGVISLVVIRARSAYWLLGLPLTSTLVVAAFYSTGGRFLVPLYGVLFSLAGLGVATTVLLAGWSLQNVWSLLTARPMPSAHPLQGESAGITSVHD